MIVERLFCRRWLAASCGLSIAICLLGTMARADIIAHYSFDGNLTLGDDSAGGGRDLNVTVLGTGTAPALTATSKFGGGAAEFFGGATTNDDQGYFYTAGTTANSFDFGTGDFAISYWYQNHHASDQSGRIFSKADSTGGNKSGTGLGLLITMSNVGGTPEIVADDCGFCNGAVSLLRETAPADDNTAFQHVVVQRTGANWEMYLDGTLVDGPRGLDGGAGTNFTRQGVAFSIGTRNVDADTGGLVGSSTANLPFEGLLDEVWVFNQALTLGEIADLNSSNTNGQDFVPEFANGDFNKDGNVSTADFDIMKANWLLTGQNFNDTGDVASPAGSGIGDGIVDLYDFRYFKNDLFPGGASALAAALAVPEPSSLILLLAAVPAWGLLRSRHRKTAV